MWRNRIGSVTNRATTLTGLVRYARLFFVNTSLSRARRRPNRSFVLNNNSTSRLMNTNNPQTPRASVYRYFGSWRWMRQGHISQRLPPK